MPIQDTVAARRMTYMRGAVTLERHRANCGSWNPWRHLHNASGEDGYLGTPRGLKFKRCVTEPCLMRTWCRKLLRTNFLKLSAQPHNVTVRHRDELASCFDNLDEAKDEAVIKHDTSSECCLYGNKLYRDMAREIQTFYTEGKLVYVCVYKYIYHTRTASVV
jgi:hypothetical protein